MHPHDSDAIRSATLISLAGNALTSVQYMLSQMAGVHVSAGALVAISALLQIVAVSGIIMARGWPQYFHTHYPKQQFLRCLLRVVANGAGMYALLHLPLTNYTVIGFFTPLLVALLCPLLLKEPLQRRALLSAALGLAGIFIIFSVSEASLLHMLIAFVAVAVTSVNAVFVRQMPRDRPLTFMFYTNLALVVVFLPFAAPEMLVLPWATWQILLGAALLSLATNYAYFYVNLIASPQYTAPLTYTQLLWSALLGWAMWNEVPPAGFWLGAGLIVFGSALLLMRPRTGA